MKTLHVVSYERASNGGFDWYHDNVTAEVAFDKMRIEERDSFCKGDEEVTVYLFPIPVSEKWDADKITDFIDCSLPELEETAKRKAVVSAPGVVRTTERVVIDELYHEDKDQLFNILKGYIEDSQIGDTHHWNIIDRSDHYTVVLVNKQTGLWVHVNATFDRMDSFAVSSPRNSASGPSGELSYETWQKIVACKVELEWA